MKLSAPYPLDYEITITRIVGVRLKALRAQAEALERALARLHERDYGTCGACGDAIPFAEIEANPAARCCAACTQGER